VVVVAGLNAQLQGSRVAYPSSLAIDNIVASWETIVASRPLRITDAK
jgi:hypothetical protein